MNTNPVRLVARARALRLNPEKLMRLARDKSDAFLTAPDQHARYTYYLCIALLCQRWYERQP